MSKVFSAQDNKISFNKGFLGIFKPEDWDRTNEAINRYNNLLHQSADKAQNFINKMTKLNPQFGNYLQNLKGAEGTMKGYGASLVGATVKTVALQAASMALNVAITWGASLAIQGIVSLGQYLWKLIPTTEHLNEQLEETHQELTDITSDLDSVNGDLQTTQDRIAELKAQGTLTFTEEAELVRLQKENAELERKRDLLLANQKVKGDEVLNDFEDSFGSEYGEKSEYYTSGRKTWWNKLIDDYIAPGLNPSFDAPDTFSGKFYTDNLFAQLADATEEDAERYKGQLNDVYADYSDYLKKLEDTNYQYGTNKQIDAYIDQINEFNDKYLVAFGHTENLFAQIPSRDKFADGYAAIKELGNVTQETLSQLYNENEKVRELINYLMGLGTVDWKTILGNDKFTELDTNADGTLTTLELFDQTTGECKVTSEQFSQAMSGVANELNTVEEAAEGAEFSFKSLASELSDGLDKLSNKKDILSEVKEELNSFGAISADNISKILEQFADDDGVQQAVAYYLSGIGTAQQVYDAMAKGYQNDLKLQAQELAAKMQNDEKYYEAIGAANQAFIKYMANNYKIDLSNCKSLAQAKASIDNSLIKNLQKNWGEYYGWVNTVSMSNIDAQIISLEAIIGNIPNSYSKLKRDYTTILNELKAIKNGTNKAQLELDKLSLKDFKTSGFNSALSTDFDKKTKEDKNKEAADKYFAKLKYNLETNKITEEQYLKSLDAAYKKYYKDKSTYLEEYEQYSQEVYDGFKDMYKEDLEAQKEAWEEKKDAVSEYYDNLREQIENAHDEEDYEKEQSEKRKEIFDLDMQIAELMRDGSEKAKARIAELEEERLKAEEELLDFETDKAREDELKRLEKEQEAEEKKIQDKIDGIQKKLDKLDEDTISVRNAIIAYATEKGVTLKFAYASGTRSSVGGIGRINEKGVEMISAPDGNGNYIPMLPNSYVFSAKATEFLWKLATEHSLPQAMYNSIAKSIKTQSSTPSVNIAQPITITMGDVIVKGNADKQTVADIKKQQENTVRMVLQKIKELQK